jgi:hypothetical protein
VWQLYHQNPKFGFYLIKLVIDRLLQNSSKRQSATGTRADGGARTCHYRIARGRSRRHRRGTTAQAGP